MVKPTIGRIVHFVVPNGRGAGEIRPALVVRVWNDTCLNLRVFLDGSNDDGASEWETSCIQTDEVAKAPRGWFWPPRV